MKVNSTASASATGGSGESSDPVVDAAQVQPLADFTVAALIAALPSPTAVFAADAPHFTVLAASDALLATSNRPREAVVGRPLAQAFPNASPEDPAATGLADLRGSLEAAVRTGAPQRMPRQRYDLERADGVWEERYWDAMNTPVPGPDGAVRYVLHQTEDVTTRVRSEQAALRSELRAARILEQVSDAHCTLDREFRIVSVNAAAERALGMPRDALLGRTHWEVFPASVDSDAGRAYRRVVADRGEQHVTQHYVGEGYDRHLEIDAYPTDEGGVAIFWRDVTERVRAETELKASEERLRLAVAATGLGRLRLGPRDRPRHRQCALPEMLGLPAGERSSGPRCWAGRAPRGPRVRRGEARRGVRPALLRRLRFEHRAVTPAGEVWLLTFGQVFFAGEGAERRAVRVIGNDLDITERKHAEAERELAHQQLQDQATELELQARRCRRRRSSSRSAPRTPSARGSSPRRSGPGRPASSKRWRTRTSRSTPSSGSWP
jgi:PAS domain S-box-containing protein